MARRFGENVITAMASFACILGDSLEFCTICVKFFINTFDFIKPGFKFDNFFQLLGITFLGKPLFHTSFKTVM